MSLFSSNLLIVTGVCVLTFTMSVPLKAEEFFNPAFLGEDESLIADLSRFNQGKNPPGKYKVDVYLNQNYIESREYEFEEFADNPNNDEGLSACITKSDLVRYNVDISRVPSLKNVDAEECIALRKAVDKAESRFSFNDLRLDISLPQSILFRNAYGYIAPSEWDNGINTAFLSYTMTGNISKQLGSHTTKGNFISLNTGVNVGAWRFRNVSTWQHAYSDQLGNRDYFDSINTYAERSIIPLKSSLVIGDSFTDSDVFKSLPFRGFSLSSDDSMLPDTQRGFAPTIRGIAQSSAKVSVRQNGNLIYETYVSPGAFEINDLFPTSSSGDLVVSISETNGSISSFTVPYSALPVLQRESAVKYNMTLGKYRSDERGNDSVFGEGTIVFGLAKGMTLYGGTQLAADYSAFSFGLGKNLEDLGAVSLDFTQANSTQFDGSLHQGMSVRLLYAKSLNTFGTNFQLLGYHYSTEGFYTLDAANFRLKNKIGPNYTLPDEFNNSFYLTEQGQVTVNISQRLGNGTFFMSGSRQTYWHSDEVSGYWQVGYNSSWNGISYRLNLSRNEGIGLDKPDDQVAFNVSFPLDRWFNGRGSDITSSGQSAYGTYSVTTDDEGNIDQQAGIAGSLLEQNNLNYSVQQGYRNKDRGVSGSASFSYQGHYGNANVGYNYSKKQRQMTYGISGSLVAHSGGITLSQPLGITNVLIEAKDAEGVAVENQTGIETDRYGYVVVPYATAYRRNRIALDPTTAKANVEFLNTVTTVVPTKGAMILADFDTKVGVRALLTITRKDGSFVPFGASIGLEGEAMQDIVGENGQAYLSGLPLNGTLDVSWGQSESEKCFASYALPEGSDAELISYANLRCE